LFGKEAKSMTPTCYMCNAEETGKEHVPPQCLFPEEKDMPGTCFRQNPIKVPSCDTHNSAKSKDDEYLLFVLASHFGNNIVAASQILTKVLRALRRRPHLQSIYTKTTKDVLLDGAETIAFQFERRRIDQELDHIARGLYYNEFMHKWDKRIAIHSPAMMVMEDKNATLVNRTTQNMAAAAAFFFDDAPRKGAHPDVFWYQMHAEPENERLVVRMCFYQGVEVIALSDPKLKENAEQE